MDDINCPQCDGEPGLLGTLGTRVHLRCRCCGWTYSIERDDELFATEDDHGN